MGHFNYRRRPTISVNVRGIPLGSAHRLRLQSMASLPTTDTEAVAAQCIRIARAGADYVRLTAQGTREAENLSNISELMRRESLDVPLVADIHFNPAAAFAAARVVEKVRINPGNFADPGRTFRKLEYTDAEYAAELDKIDRALTPLLDVCRECGTALRIGVNHGSLSDRIMSRYGDTPEGVVESAMEYLRVCVRRGFTDVVVSIKSSNVAVMVQTVRLMAQAMEREAMAFPLHLGVTEAGDGEDGRVKSAVGIGTLLCEGLGDTIRVSLSEDPEHEIPVARALADYIALKADAPDIAGEPWPGYDPLCPRRRESADNGLMGGSRLPAVAGLDFTEAAAEAWPRIEAGTPVDDIVLATGGDATVPIVLTCTSNPDFTGAMEATLHALMRAGVANPVVLHRDYGSLPADTVRLHAAVDMGTLLMHGFRDALWLQASTLTPAELQRLALGILQAARLRFSHTEYIACPSCGRTLFDLQHTLQRVREATSHLKGLKIGVMGCIVNGPGEMADADYGYIGAARGKVSLYKGKQLIEKNIPADQAIPRLIALIKEGGDWTEPPAR